MVLEAKENGVPERRRAQVAPTPFGHRSYQYYRQYPRGLADMAGYWAESNIFGGVFVFDRGESEKEARSPVVPSIGCPSLTLSQCKALWIHGDLFRGPKTLYPPTQDQFDSLVKFLLARPSDEPPPCPLPIRGMPENRPRWDPYQAFAYYHIFRDRYERAVPPEPPQSRCVQSAQDWPELNDELIIRQEGLVGAVDPSGQPYVEAEQVAAAKINIYQLTPSSPLWPMMSEEIQRRNTEMND